MKFPHCNANVPNETYNASDDLIFHLLEQRSDTGNKMLCFLEIEKNHTNDEFPENGLIMNNMNACTCYGNGKYQSDADPKRPVEIRL